MKKNKKLISHKVIKKAQPKPSTFAPYAIKWTRKAGVKALTLGDNSKAGDVIYTGYNTCARKVLVLAQELTRKYKDKYWWKYEIVETKTNKVLSNALIS